MSKDIIRTFWNFSKKWIGVVFGIVFLHLAIRNTDLSATFSTIKSVSLVPIVAVIAVKAFALMVRGLRWRIVLEHVKVISSFQLFRVLSIGEMGNYLFPARFGEVIRILIISKKANISKSAILASVFVDRFLDLVTVLMIVFSFSLFIPLPRFIAEARYVAFAVALFFVLGSLALFLLNDRLKSSSRFSSAFFAGLMPKLKEAVNRFTLSLRGLRNFSQILRASFISVFLWGLYTLSFHLVILGLDIQVSWYISAITVAIIGLGMIVPSTPGFVGTYEFFCVATLTFFSVEKSMALACAIISHLLQYVVVICIGTVSYFFENIQFDKTPSVQSQALKLDEVKLHS